MASICTYNYDLNDPIIMLFHDYIIDRYFNEYR
jgi:hypothetical protein